MLFAIIILIYFVSVPSAQYLDLKKDFDILREKYDYGVRSIHYIRRQLSENLIHLDYLSNSLYIYIIYVLLGIHAKRENHYVKLNCIKLISYLI